jgi:hypothetical protein
VSEHTLRRARDVTALLNYFLLQAEKRVFAVACELVLLSGPEFCLERHSLAFLVRPMPVLSSWQGSLQIFGVL